MCEQRGVFGWIGMGSARHCKQQYARCCENSQKSGHSHRLARKLVTLSAPLSVYNTKTYILVKSSTILYFLCHEYFFFLS